MALTNRKRLYAEARLAGKGQKDAALAAGCPEKSAKQAGYEMERDPDVKAAMSRTVAVQERQKTAAAEADPDTHIPAKADDPLEFMKQFMNDLNADPKLRLDAAKALASFTVSKPGEKGKKEQVQEAAEQVASGRFGLRKPGQLKAVK